MEHAVRGCASGKTQSCLTGWLSEQEEGGEFEDRMGKERRERAGTKTDEVLISLPVCPPDHLSFELPIFMKSFSCVRCKKSECANVKKAPRISIFDLSIHFLKGYDFLRAQLAKL